MNEMDAANRAFEQCVAFLAALQNRGLKHAIISPGSRSTPLVLAAASISKLQKRVILDERSAGFTALGIGKASQNPAALICTSGTAAANYLPAVIEARKSGVPLLLLTADRPGHLQNSGANQTINQIHLYGDYPVYFHHVKEKDLYGKNGNSLQALAAQSIYSAKKEKGPVHINLPFRKPLEPTEEVLESINDEVLNPDDSFFPHDAPSKHPETDYKHLKKTIQDAERQLIIIGQLTDRAELKPIFRLAGRLNAPVLSEQGIWDDANAIQAFEGFLRNRKNQKKLEPDLVLRFGREPASKSLLASIKAWAPNHHIHFSGTGEKSDIAQTTTAFIRWKDAPALPQIPQRSSHQWLNCWKKIERQYLHYADHLLEQKMALTDGHIYDHIAPIIPKGWNISFSNSFAARDHSMFGRWNQQNIYTNRGVSGIDGITSTAMGVNIGSGQPGVLFTGDLAFLHDIGAILNHRKIPEPLVIIILNNQGGSIFRMLPIAEQEKYFETYFETPQQADLSAIAKSYGVTVQKVETKDQLKKIDIKHVVSTSEQKMCIIECKTDPVESMNLRKKLWDTEYAFGD
jgi:2-succinyl-5-enolpyruvyl-6-hydroxy-3-cyclohexene-1-carboxylate synthase